MSTLNTLPLGELFTLDGREYRTRSTGGDTVTVEPTAGGPRIDLPGSTRVEVVAFAFGAFA